MEETGESANALVFGRVRSTQARGESGVTVSCLSHPSALITHRKLKVLSFTTGGSAANWYC